MDVLLKEYIIRKEKIFTKYDHSYVNFIKENTQFIDQNMILDCHGLRRDEVVYFLEFLDVIECKMCLKLITGKGNHSKKPKMDYYCSKIWKSPLKQVIVNYYTKTGRGTCIKEFPCYVLIKLR